MCSRAMWLGSGKAGILSWQAHAQNSYSTSALLLETKRQRPSTKKKKKEIGVFKNSKQSLYGKQDSELPTQHQSWTKSQGWH